MFFFFFFSSRRRHTRSLRDWSSDVCSSDLRAHWLAGIEQVEILLLRAVRRDQRREDRARHEDRDEEGAEDRARVADEPVPGLTPQSGGSLDLNLSCFELGDRNQLYRMRGLMIAYEMSTSRFTRTNTIARKRMPPCKTG